MKSRGMSKRKLKNGGMSITPADLGNKVQETMAYYQPVPTRTCWTPPAMGWAEDGVGLAAVESPELCQRLDVAGGDTTKALECASWVPAVFAVRTGLGREDSPRVYF